VKVDELEEELHTKTDQLLHAFSRQNELESEISSVRKQQHAALENAAKLESDVCHRLIYN
jgi:chromosome segregation ATPase